jgi:hypothetical protein
MSRRFLQLFFIKTHHALNSSQTFVIMADQYLQDLLGSQGDAGASQEQPASPKSEAASGTGWDIESSDGCSQAETLPTPGIASQLPDVSRSRSPRGRQIGAASSTQLTLNPQIDIDAFFDEERSNDGASETAEVSDGDSERDLKMGRVPAIWARGPAPPKPIPGCEWWAPFIFQSVQHILSQRGGRTRPMLIDSNCAGLAMEVFGSEVSHCLFVQHVWPVLLDHTIYSYL